MDVGGCDLAPGAQNRPGVIVALVRASSSSAMSERSFAGRGRAPVREAGDRARRSVSRS